MTYVPAARARRTINMYRPEVFSTGEALGASATAAANPAIRNRIGDFLMRARDLMRNAGTTASTVARNPLARKVALGTGAAAALLGTGLQTIDTLRQGDDADIGGQLAGNVIGGGIGAGLGALTGPLAPVAMPVLGGIGSQIGGNIGRNFNLIPDSKEGQIRAINERAARDSQLAGNNPQLQNAIENERVNSVAKVMGYENMSAGGGSGSDSVSGTPQMEGNVTTLTEDELQFRPMTDREMIAALGPGGALFEAQQASADRNLNRTRLLNQDKNRMGMQYAMLNRQSEAAADALAAYMNDTDSHRRFLAQFVNNINYR